MSWKGTCLPDYSVRSLSDQLMYAKEVKEVDIYTAMKSRVCWIFKNSISLSKKKKINRLFLKIISIFFLWIFHNY